MHHTYPQPDRPVLDIPSLYQAASIKNYFRYVARNELRLKNEIESANSQRYLTQANKNQHFNDCKKLPKGCKSHVLMQTRG